MRRLIEAKADLDHKDARGDTALSFAAARGQRQNVTLLLDFGAQPEAIDRAFVAAAHFGQPDMARLLLDRGADVKEVGAEALVRAITQDSSSTVNDNVKFLVDVVGGVSAQDGNGGSGVHLAASRGNAALMRLLLEKGPRSTAHASARATLRRVTGRHFRWWRASGDPRPEDPI